MSKSTNKAGTMHCFSCEHKWQVKDRHAYQQCPKCRAYRVHSKDSIAYYYAMKERKRLENINNITDYQDLNK